jgi:hypothetical protein
VDDDQTSGVNSYYVTPHWSIRDIALSDYEKAEALADSLETLFLPVTDPSIPAVTEMVDVALRSYFLTPSSEPKLTKPDVVQEAPRSFKTIKGAVPNCIPNRA